MIRDDGISCRQPLGTGWLRSHSRSSIDSRHPPTDHSLQTNIIPTVDHDPLPVRSQRVSQHRDLHHDGPVDILHSGADLAEDMGVCDRLQGSQFLPVVEDDGGEGATGDLALFDDLGPPSSYLVERWTIGPQHLMSNGIGVDGVDTLALQELSNQALPRSQPSAQDPSALLRTHETGR